MAVQCIPARCEIRIPCKAEFVGIVRLAMLGIASRLQFTYDEIEDIRLAVGEACIIIINKVAHSVSKNRDLIICADINSNNISISVQDIFTESEPHDCREVIDEDGDSGIALCLIELLTDEFNMVQTEDDITLIKMTKFVGNN